MPRPSTSVCLAAAALWAGSASAQITFTETFDAGSNVGGWSFNPGSRVEPTGGNPGGRLFTPFIDSFIPALVSDAGESPSVFTGDFRGRQVTDLGADFAVFELFGAPYGRDLALGLYSDGGTPGDPNDDWMAFTVSDADLLQPGEGWVRAEFDVPSQEGSLPAGWSFQEFGPDAEPDWNALITGVDRTIFFLGDPSLFFISFVASVGVDNISVTAIPAPGAWVVMGACGCAMLRRRRRAGVAVPG